VSAAVLVIGISGCTGTDLGGAAQSTAPGLPIPSGALATTKPTTSTTAPTAQATDYRGLLLSAGDLSDADDNFNERSRNSDPNNTPGASAFFVNDQDNRAISDTFLVYPDAATATAALRQATGTLPTLVTGGAPTPIAVGTDGVMISGTYPDQDKSVTLMLFTEGRALVRLEFQSAPGDVTTDQFVTNIGKMQEIALRVGLADS